MKNGYLYLFLLLILSLSFIYGQVNITEQLKYSTVKIHITKADDIKTILKSGISLDNIKSEADGIQVILNQQEIKKVAELGYEYTIEIADLQDHYEKHVLLPKEQIPSLQKQMKQEYGIKGFEFGSMGGYYTFDQAVTELDSMRLLYPDLISEKQSIGTSIQGRDIWMVKISDNPDSDEDDPEIFYNALHHAKEPQGLATIMYFMYYLLENYGSNPLVTYLIENRELYFVPIVNPDGYVHNESTHPNGGGMWYKNMRDNNGNNVFGETVDGVNNNNNYGFQWGYDDIGSSSDFGHPFYRGTGPFSEPETQAIRDFCLSHDFRLSLNFHTYGNHIYLPWGYELYSHTPDSIQFINLAEQFSQYNNYTWSVSTPVWPVVNGILQDWLYGEQDSKNKTFSFTFELGSSFWPSQTDIYPIAHNNLYPQLLLALGEGVIFPDSLLITNNSSLNAHFLAPGMDDIIITTDVLLPDSVNEQPRISAMIENLDQTYREYISLVPVLPKGGITSSMAYKGTQKAPLAEDYYQVSLTGQLDMYNLFTLEYMDKFATRGPVKVDQFYITGNDTIVNPGDFYLKFELSLNNEGKKDTVKNITINPVFLNPCTKVAGLRLPEFADIPPGESITGSRPLGITFTDSCLGGPIDFALEIMSDGYVFWTDTFHVEVIVGLEDQNNDIPKTFALKQNYPNPFNPTTMVNYQLAKNSVVNLSIYNILGQKVSTLINKKQTAGKYSVEWDASGFASGIYYYHLKAGDFDQVKKMVLIK